MKVNRIAYLVTRRFYKVPWLFHQIKLAGKENKYTIDERYKKVHDVCHRVNKYAHVNITCTGLENLPKEIIRAYLTSCLFVIHTKDQHLL